MSESIRERIGEAGASGEPARRLQIWQEFIRGNLIPKDEHEAAAAEAVRAERERACAAVCKRCAAGSTPTPIQRPGIWVHQYAFGANDGLQDCDAAAIRSPILNSQPRWP